MSAGAVLLALGGLTLVALGWLAVRYGGARQQARDAAVREQAAREVAEAIAEVDESVGVAARPELIRRMRQFADGD